MNVYIKEIGAVRTLLLKKNDSDITEQYLLLVRDNCLFPAPPEIVDDYCVDYCMYKDDYNDCAALLNEQQKLINKASKNRQTITTALYEIITEPGRVIEYNK
jgi:hypothetical protein